ncbi:MAG: hypothetical protein J5858_09315 [Lentisphaeria bacterium]|nr:hypothetical protein [Lentisphaeria bacterium]
MDLKSIPAPIIRTGAEPIRLISIIPMFSGRVEYLADLIRERHRYTSISEFALSCSLHPQGDDPLKKLELAVKTFRKLKKLLSDTPSVRLGILFQSLIGHGSLYNPNSRCTMPGVHLMKLSGEEDPRYCPIGRNFLKYIRTAVTLMAKEKPAFCLTDDDLRLDRDFCACRLHLAEISRRSGLKVSRTRLVKALERATVPPEQLSGTLPMLRKNAIQDDDDRIAAAFIESKIDSVRKLSMAVREALDMVDPGLICGSCTCYEPVFVGPRMEILTGRAGSPFLRIANGLYQELAVKDLALRMSWTGIQQVMFRNRGWQLLDETDTCPQNRYSKNARTMHLHLAVGLAQGLDGGKLWLDQGTFPLREVSRPYEAILAKHQGFYRELRSLVKLWKPEGLVTRVLPPERGVPCVVDWCGACFNHMGIPCFYGDMKDPGITALAGSQVNLFNDEEITRILSGKVLIDGEAALHLTQRGFASLIGVKATQKEFAASYEECLLTGICTSFTAGKQAVFFQPLPGSETIGKVKLRQFIHGPSKLVMPGTVYFRNRLGGEIICSAMMLRQWHFMHVLSPGRKLVYTAWLNRLGGLSCYEPEDVSIKLFSGQMKDGSRGVALFNFSYDPIKVRLCVKNPECEVLELQPEGDWKPVGFSYQNSLLIIDKTLETAGIGIYRLR